MAQMIDKYDAREEKKSLSMVQKNYKKTKLDGNFQRHGGVGNGSGWTIKNSNAYLSSLLDGTTFNTIIVAHAGDCLRFAEEVGDEDSIEYFKNILLEGFEFVSIDGNNTSSTVDAFLEGHEDIFIRRNGKKKKLVNFTEDEQEEIKYNEKIRFITLRKIGIKGMCDLFRALNTSTKLNNQEWRQARWSELSQFIRDISNGDQRLLFKNFIFNKDIDLDKRYHEEMVAFLAMKINYNYSSQAYMLKRYLDIFYKENSSLPIETQNKLRVILETCSGISEATGALKKKLAKGALHALWDVIEVAIYSFSLNINHLGDFFEWFLKTHSEFTTASGQVLEENMEEESYSYWTQFYSRPECFKRTRSLFKSALVGDLEDLINSGVISYKRTSKDSFTWEQKLELYQKQNGKTRKEEEMSYLDLYLGKYEADHMVPVKDGGKTEITNGELMLKEDNRKKGSDSNEPHFLHQIPEEQQLEIAINE